MNIRTRTIPNDLRQLPEGSRIRELVGLLAVSIENAGIRHNFNFSHRTADWLTIQLRLTIRKHRARAQATWREPDNMLRVRLTELVPNDYRNLGDRLRICGHQMTFDLGNESMFNRVLHLLLKHLLEENEGQVPGENDRLIVTTNQTEYEEGVAHGEKIALSRLVRGLKFTASPRDYGFWSEVHLTCEDPQKPGVQFIKSLPSTAFASGSYSLSTLSGLFSNQMRAASQANRQNGESAYAELKSPRLLVEGMDISSGERFYSYLSETNFEDNFTFSRNTQTRNEEEGYDANPDFSSHSNWGLLAPQR